MKILIGLMVIAMVAVSGCKTAPCCKKADKPAAAQAEKAEAKAEKVEAKAEKAEAQPAKEAKSKIEMVAVESSMIDAIGYDADAKVLKIKFDSGDTYKYKGVDAATHKKLMSAKSKGTFFEKHIKDKYEAKKCD